ncbi:MAG: hypothetical protein E7495_07070 [Ruminococcus flavefaciens]|jgi:hypothetical protein|nr:hypothetical protein [Ruminococcus flavefaciens]
MGITIKSLLITTGIILCLPLAALLTLSAFVVKRMKEVPQSQQDADAASEIIDIEAVESGS